MNRFLKLLVYGLGVSFFAGSFAHATVHHDGMAPIGGNAARLVYGLLESDSDPREGTIFLKAIVTERRSPAYRYEIRVTVDGVPQAISRTQKEQDELFQTLRASGIPMRTFSGGTQYSWIWIHASCTTGENGVSCELEDLGASTLGRFSVAAGDSLRLVNMGNVNPNSCEFRVNVHRCAPGEVLVSCIASGQNHGVGGCTCCWRGY